MLLPVKSFKFPYNIWRKYVISSIAMSIDFIAFSGTPNSWRTARTSGDRFHVEPPETTDMAGTYTSVARKWPLA